MNSRLIFFLSLLLSAFGLSSLSAQASVPQSVEAAFAAKFPKAQKVVWEVEEAEEYEAEFRQKGKRMSANFGSDGKWLETETELKVATLPAVIKQAVLAQFAGYEIAEAEMLEKPGLAMAYELELTNKTTEAEIEALFAADGTLLEQSEEEDDDDQQ